VLVQEQEQEQEQVQGLVAGTAAGTAAAVGTLAVADGIAAGSAAGSAGSHMEISAPHNQTEEQRQPIQEEYPTGKDLLARIHAAVAIDFGFG